MTAPIAGASRAAAVTSLTRAAIATGLQQQCFIVRDGKGQALTYVYFEEEPGRRAAAKLLTRDEARRIAANVAKLGRPIRARVSSLELTKDPDRVRSFGGYNSDGSLEATPNRRDREQPTKEANPARSARRRPEIGRGQIKFSK